MLKRIILCSIILLVSLSVLEYRTKITFYRWLAIEIIDKKDVWVMRTVRQDLQRNSFFAFLTGVSVGVVSTTLSRKDKKFEKKELEKLLKEAEENELFEAVKEEIYER